MEIKQHHGHLSYKQPAVRLLKTKKSVKICVNPWLILTLTNYGTKS